MVDLEDKEGEVSMSAGLSSRHVNSLDIKSRLRYTKLQYMGI